MKSVKSLDKTALVNLYNIGGKDFLLKMIDNFMAQSPNRIKAAQSSLGSGDMKAIHLIAHSLKASAANLGAAKVQDLAEKLEEMASVGLKEHMSEAIDRLEGVLTDAIQCLKSERELWGTGETP